MDFWFRADSQADRTIANRYAATLEAAASGALDAWEAQPRSCLALVVVLDQFPRNIYRGSAAAFAHDARALAVTRRGVAAGHLRALETLEQGFLLMPFQHSEDLARQREGLELFERMLESAPPQWHSLTEGMVRYARLHRDIVERFGRFPHRNAILARESTAAELEYLATDHDSFGQTSV